jgi:hypothetical protein
MSLTIVACASCLICVGFNLSLDACVRSPYRKEASNCSGPALKSAKVETYPQDNGLRLNVPLH